MGGDFYGGIFLGGGVGFFFFFLQYGTVQYNTVQYSTVQYNTVQYNTVQYSTVPPNPQSWWCGEGGGEEKVYLKTHGSTSGDRG